MKGSTVIPQSVQFNQPDNNWLLQGRIIPASVTGKESVLYLQTRHVSWGVGHFHTGHSNIPPELAVEIAMAICVPFNPGLLAKSYDFVEHAKGLLYTHMAKMQEPPDTVGFITVTGLTAMIQLASINTLFRYDKDCQACLVLENQSVLSEELLDKLEEELLAGGTDERSH